MPAVENVRSLVTVEAVGASQAGSKQASLPVPDEPDSTMIICCRCTVVNTKPQNESLPKTDDCVCLFLHVINIDKFSLLTHRHQAIIGQHIFRLS